MEAELVVNVEFGIDAMLIPYPETLCINIAW